MLGALAFAIGIAACVCWMWSVVVSHGRRIDKLESDLRVERGFANALHKKIWEKTDD